MLEWCHPVGEADSEYAFCYILEKLSGLRDKGLESLAVRLWSLAKEIGRYGKFNFLPSDGKCLARAIATINWCWVSSAASGISSIPSCIWAITPRGNG